MTPAYMHWALYRHEKRRASTIEHEGEAQADAIVLTRELQLGEDSREQNHASHHQYERQYHDQNSKNPALPTSQRIPGRRDL